MKLKIVPCSVKQANSIVEKWHRHNKPVKVARFACAVEDEEGVCHGAAIVGNPVAQKFMDGYTAEVVRVATDGMRNACSMLYAACIRACKALGFRRVVTYTLKSESGSSMRAVGFHLDTDHAGGVPWTNRPGRSSQSVCLEVKNRWSICLAKKGGTE